MWEVRGTDFSHGVLLGTNDMDNKGQFVSQASVSTLTLRYVLHHHSEPCGKHNDLLN